MGVPRAEERQSRYKRWFTFGNSFASARTCQKTTKGRPARPYDLRHTFATVGAGGGLTLPLIGRLLGHTQARTLNATRISTMIRSGRPQQ